MARFRPHRMYPGALLAQEACAYQAMTQLLARVRGDLVVLVHGDRDCANVLPKTRRRVHGLHPYKFLCTQMTEDELVTGQGNARLRRALEVIHASFHPALVVVLSTCPTVMIGDDVQNVSRKAARDLGMRIVAPRTHGLRPKSPAEVIDTLYAALCEAADPPAGDVTGRLVLAGLDLDEPERAGLRAVLGRMGLTLQTTLHHDADLADFLGAGQAAACVHPGPNMLIEFRRLCAERFGQRTIEVPLPYGVAATDRFFAAIAQGHGVAADTLATALEPERAPAAAALAAFRARLAGRTLRVAYNIGSVRSFDLSRIALEELGELPMFDELGCEVELFIQGPQDDDNRERTAQVLQALGVRLPFTIFPDPGGLHRHLEHHTFDVFYGARFLRDQLARVRLPLWSHFETCLGYRGVPHNLAFLQAILDDGFYRHFRTGGPEA